MNIQYRQAVASDAVPVHKICKNYYDKKVLKRLFTADQMEALIATGQFVVATDNGKVIGYYLINDIFKDKDLFRREKIVTEMISKGILKQGRYAYMTSAGVAPEYKNQHIGHYMLLLLRALVSTKYDYISGVVYAHNAGAIKAHLLSGWQLYEMEMGWIGIIGTIN